ncbi:Hypothetical_protein [Hexamita inflata]|uniref:Hypothetical_protein n=1 Tax=Hexamita inflata TaxID=28002 RepID=A0ABP1KHK5_9EUKA
MYNYISKLIKVNGQPPQILNGLNSIRNSVEHSNEPEQNSIAQFNFMIGKQQTEDNLTKINGMALNNVTNSTRCSQSDIYSFYQENLKFLLDQNKFQLNQIEGQLQYYQTCYEVSESNLNKMQKHNNKLHKYVNKISAKEK